MILEEILDVLPETVDVFLYTEEDDNEPAAIYDGRNSIDLKYNSRTVRFLTVSNGNKRREAFQRALMAGAAGIIIWHNHPSGDITPSSYDIDATERMVVAGNIIGIMFDNAP